MAYKLYKTIITILSFILFGFLSYFLGWVFYHIVKDGEITMFEPDPIILTLECIGVAFINLVVFILFAYHIGKLVTLWIGDD